jgi:hypothetical protein
MSKVCKKPVGEGIKQKIELDVAAMKTSNLSADPEIPDE